MDANMKKRNELLAKTVIKGLESRNMSGYYAQDEEAALKGPGTDPKRKHNRHGRMHECT